MSVTENWTNPQQTTPIKMDLAPGDTLPEVTWDAAMSNLLVLGGTTGMVRPKYGGTGIDTSGSTGVPTVTAGSWSTPAQLPPVRGGTGIDTSAATGIPSVSSGAWSVVSQIPAVRGGTGLDTSSSTGFPTIQSGAWSVSAFPQPGNAYFSYVGATSVSLVPFNGNFIKINGKLYTIPSSGVTGTNAGLSANTLYYVYLYNNAGTLSLEFSTTVHATSATAGNAGVEIKSGDDTRTLVGMVYTNASSQFTPNLVSSWFNRRLRSWRAGFTADRSTSSTSFVELNAEIRVSFLLWGGESHTVLYNGAQSEAGGTTGTIETAAGFDGTADLLARCMRTPSTSLATIAGGTARTGDSEGFHYWTLLTRIVGSGTTTVWGGTSLSVTWLG